MLRLASIAALLLLSCAGCASSFEAGRTAEGAKIVQIPLRWSNVYLVESRVPILVDTGTLGDMHDLENALAERNVVLREIGLVVVTHAHADHAGLAADLRARTGAKIVLGAGDTARAHEGHNDELRPTSFLASALKPTIPQIFPEFTPDVAVADEPLDLAPWGIGGKVVQMPGHTPGSVVVLLSNHAAFVGDEMLGGVLGMLFPHDPREHYYQADPERNRRNVAELVRMGVDTFYLGHGGPVSREDVVRAFAL
jgi:glyoxylase-like metal-dependent hydrolase (beta-lactamase superfamily II)